MASADLDADTAEARRLVGRAVSKSEVIRELLGVLHGDPALLAEVVERLRAKPPRI